MKILVAFSSLLVFSTLALLTGCSSSSSTTTTTPPPVVAITANTGTTPQSTAVSTAFATPLAVTVTSGGTPASNVTVTFTAPASGASGVFTTGGTATETDTTGPNGVATCSGFTANTAAGAYTVTATATGATSPASFSLTNTAGAPAGLAISSGNNQGATVSTGFPALVAQVTDIDSNPVQGVSVTFTANPGSSGATGAFTSSTSNTETATTDVNGNATVSDLTANATTGAFTVTASSTGLTSVNFTETNLGLASSGVTYVYYMSGQELPNSLNGGLLSYYAIAGAVAFDASGDVLGGEQDYNDGSGNTSPGEPTTPDTIAPAVGALVVDPTTGLGTLTVTSSNTNVGVGGVETFAVQFVNANHALITQFDGSATSSGSLDLQTLANANGNFAFAITGINPNYDSVAFGGVYSASGNSVAGTMDVNDLDGGVLTNQAFSATTGTTDAFGRTVVTGVTDPAFGNSITFVSYEVTAEALRIIDVDTTDSAVGSAFGQGTNGTSATTASLGSSVFTLIGQWSTTYASVGQFATDANGNITSGTADDNELDNGIQAVGAPITGTYTVGSNGYSSISISGNGDVATLGLYLTDPTLNLNDPNNVATDPGGALVIELDALLPGGMGVITPQTDPTATDFTNNANPAYVAGFQDINQYAACDCEFDMVGPFTMTSGFFSTAAIGADDSDPLGTWDGTPEETTGDTFASTPLPVVPGYFSMSDSNSTPNGLQATIGGSEFDLGVDIYQASATTLYWLEFDDDAVFLGPIEQQSSLTGVPALKKPAAKANSQTQPAKAPSGRTH
jgi:hypothetical protein